MTPTPWTPAEDDIIREGVAAGRTFAAMSGQLPGRSKQAVISRARRMGIKTHKVVPGWSWPLEDTERLRALVKSGRTTRQIMVEMGRSKDSIKNRCVILGLKPAASAVKVPTTRYERSLPHVSTPVVHIHHGEAGEAQRYLQRAGYVVYRSDADGRQVQDGFFWVCGSLRGIDDVALVAKADAVKALQQARAA